MIWVALLLGAALVFVAGWSIGRRPSEHVVAPDPAPTEPSAATESDRFALVEQHRVGVVVTDDAGVIVWRNAAAQGLAGTHAGVLVDEAIERHVQHALDDGHSEDVLEMYGPPKVVLDIEARRLTGDGVVVFIDDVSERRRIEQVRTDFVANISHELKTPVGALAVLAETLEDETDPETVRRIVDRMQVEAARATRTIDDLMELSRIELGGERETEPIRLTDVMNEAMGRVAELAAQREVGVSNLMSAGQFDDVMVDGDRRQLISALGNLVENAVKYSEPNGLVQVRARYDDGQVELSVSDEGLGIPQRDLDRIFERFYRVDRARSRVTGGTGLGLSIVRHVAQNHGGEVAVTSIEGEGSTFVLRLPARRAGDHTGDDIGDSADARASAVPSTPPTQPDADPEAGSDVHEGIA
jgi:two-component system sensor histidine kinase SenX3